MKITAKLNRLIHRAKSLLGKEEKEIKEEEKFLESFLAGKKSRKKRYIISLSIMFIIFFLAGLLIGNYITLNRLKELQLSQSRWEKDQLETMRVKVRRMIMNNNVSTSSGENPL